MMMEKNIMNAKKKKKKENDIGLKKKRIFT